MILATTLYNALFGLIIGFIWALALKLNIHNCLINGTIIGGSIGLLLGIYQKMTEIKMKQELRQMSRTIGTFSSIIFILNVVIGLIFWLIHSLFF